MKTVMMLMCLISVLLIGCNEVKKPFSVSGYGDNDAFGIRAGYRVTDSAELGILSEYYPNEHDDSQIWGIYGAYHFDDLVDIPNPFGDDDIPASPYIGLQTALNNMYDEQVSLFAGSTFWDIFFVEYQSEPFSNKVSSDQDKAVIGLRWRF